jgi:hypothetical protein
MILINSIPRSGTNLLKYFLTEVAGISGASYIPHMLENDWRARLAALKEREPDGMYWMHCPHTPAVARWIAANATMFYVYRHPGAVAVSWTRWILSSDQNPFYPIFADMDFDDALTKMIVGNGDAIGVETGEWPGLARLYRSFDGWYEDADLLVSYDDMLTDGDHTAYQIAERLGVNANEYELAAAASSALNQHGYTYRQGTIDGWREAVRQEHLDALEKEGLLDYV